MKRDADIRFTTEAQRHSLCASVVKSASTPARSRLRAYPFPKSAGARTLPTAPASASSVSRYGSIRKS